MTFSTTIRELQQAITKSPRAGAVTFQAEHDLVAATEVEVRIGDHRITVDEPPVLGGTAHGPNPVELALASLGSCQAITYRVWAELLGVRIDKISVRVEGKLDLRGFLGVDDSVRTGFNEVRVVVSLQGPETAERYIEFQREADRYCPVLDLFQNSVPVTTELELELEPLAVVA